LAARGCASDLAVSDQGWPYWLANRLVALARAGGPLAPAPLYGPEYSSPAGVRERHAVNAWIRDRSRAYAWPAFDFDRVLADPSFPNSLSADGGRSSLQSRNEPRPGVQ
jgi:hypothetical protein